MRYKGALAPVKDTCGRLYCFFGYLQRRCYGSQFFRTNTVAVVIEKIHAPTVSALGKWSYFDQSVNIDEADCSVLNGIKDLKGIRRCQFINIQKSFQIYSNL